VKETLNKVCNEGVELVDSMLGLSGRCVWKMRAGKGGKYRFARTNKRHHHHRHKISAFEIKKPTSLSKRSSLGCSAFYYESRGNSILSHLLVQMVFLCRVV